MGPLRALSKPPIRRGFSIFVKLLAVIVSLVLVSTAVLASYLISSQVEEQRTELESKAQTYGRFTAKQVESAVAFADRETAREAFDSLAHEDQDVESLTLFTASGAILHARGALGADVQAPLRQTSQIATFSNVGRIGVAVPVVSLEGPRGTLLLELSTRRLNESRARLLRRAFEAGLLAAAAGALGALLIARSLSKRVGAIAVVAQAVAGGDLAQPPVRAGPSGDEIDSLAQAFNAMLLQLQELVSQIRESARQEQTRLETQVQARTAELALRNDDMRRVLNNVGQGFFTLGLDGKMSQERSEILETWFGPVPGSGLFVDYLEAVDRSAAAWFAVCWESVVDGQQPLLVSIGQLPAKLTRDGRHFELEYRPLLSESDELERLVVVISDVTAAREGARAETDERELTRLFSRLVADRQGFSEFFVEADALVDGIQQALTSAGALGRCLHTLKGNAALYGIDSVSSLAHELEDRLAERGSLNEADLLPILARWSQIRSKVRALIGEARTTIEVEDAEYRQALAAIDSGTSRVRLREMLLAWRLEPTELRFQRMAEQAQALAARLGKAPIAIELHANGIRLARERWRSFWAAAIHVVRNAVDHGIELAAERPPHKSEGRLTLCTRLQGDTFAIEFSDNGAGIAWDLVKLKAAALGLPTRSHTDLVNALFAEGLTTRDTVTDVSGRGIGLAAAQRACEELGGRVEVESQAGQGTTIRFVWPAHLLATGGTRPIKASGPPPPTGLERAS